MPNQIQRNRAQSERGNDPHIGRDHEQLGADGERQRREDASQRQQPPRGGQEEEE